MRNGAHRPRALAFLLASLTVSMAATSCGARRGEPAPDSPAPSSRGAPLPPGTGSAQRAESASFKAAVAPMLAERCAPCHIPGGKMYAALPFDDPGVVRSHPEGVLKRLKSEEDRALFQAWLATPAETP